MLCGAFDCASTVNDAYARLINHAAANLVMVELGAQPLREFIFANFGADCQLHVMAAFNNCSSVMIFNSLQAFLDGSFSAAATKARSSSGTHTIAKKGSAYGFGESLFDESAFINVVSYRYVVKSPSLYDVNLACNSDGVERGHDAHIKECKATLSLRELNNVCVGGLQPLLEYIESQKSDYSHASTSCDRRVYDNFCWLLLILLLCVCWREDSKANERSH